MNSKYSVMGQHLFSKLNNNINIYDKFFISDFWTVIFLLKIRLKVKIYAKINWYKMIINYTSL